MKSFAKWTAVALAVCLPLSAQAHRAWMLPSATVLSGDEPWITVDAAVSNDLFYFEHFPMQLAGVGDAPQAGPGGMRRPPAQLVISAPDGSAVEPQNGHRGRYRSTFDVQLSQKGTYKLAVANSGLMAMWKENGETRRWMGSAEELAANVPEKAEERRVVRTANRMETFVTSGAPTESVFTPTNVGLELVPTTHPNDLFAGEAAEFAFLLDGKPAADVEVLVVPGGNRYRDQTGDFTLKTDSEGKVNITWPEPGMYWIEVELSGSEGVEAPATERRAAYSATLEVLAP
ncbi:DUF4198 domain-containing protein [Stutzerimonas tarimensis]|uniref:DUF4198 domain-containing protein n=1 Tax=Stutzerimonas tarimensis TaxID=1507735 RepID=A0ABV7T584_9GAMM